MKLRFNVFTGTFDLVEVGVPSEVPAGAIYTEANDVLYSEANDPLVEE